MIFLIGSVGYNLYVISLYTSIEGYNEEWKLSILAVSRYHSNRRSIFAYMLHENFSRSLPTIQLIFVKKISYIVRQERESCVCFNKTYIFCDYFYYSDVVVWSVVNIYNGVWLTSSRYRRLHSISQHVRRICSYWPLQWNRVECCSLKPRGQLDRILHNSR